MILDEILASKRAEVAARSSSRPLAALEAAVLSAPTARVQMALWPRDSIAHDTGLPRSARAPAEVTIAQNVRSQEEVDQVMAQATAAGAKILQAPIAR